jgi:hypothetical protein
VVDCSCDELDSSTCVPSRSKATSSRRIT